MSINNAADQQICNEIVTNIAKLAKLRLTDDEIIRFQSDFTGLLEMFHALDDLELDDDYLPERIFVNAEDCREDEIVMVNHKGLEKAAKHYDADTGYFNVPQFIGEDNE
jgi:aspartyl/glutamyl-tRNA(Asn/Gln) amidotransferase C subunit